MAYTGSHGELDFEEDFIDLLTKAGWETTIIKNKTIDDLIENWRTILFERNRIRLNDVPLSKDEMDRVLDVVNQQANTPVKANHFINGRPIAILRDSNSPDIKHAGNEVYLEVFSVAEVAGGRSRYQIAEQTYFNTSSNFNDRRGDITLLIDGMPVIHIELKASGVDVNEAANQIIKYAQEGIWKGFMGLVQVFWAITPEDAIYFANGGDSFNPAFFFRWADVYNKPIKDWQSLITGKHHILSIPEAHKFIGHYSVADTAKDTLKVCRSYQVAAIRAIVQRTAKQVWGNLDQLGGFCWNCTGSGKSLVQFKAGQMIIDFNLADKVLFIVDRKVLDEQSSKDYNSFERSGESICETYSSRDLFNKLESKKLSERLIVTSIQKISKINHAMANLRPAELDIIKSKRIVFIIDEAHRSQFGVMHEVVKKTFSGALFFGFTGTPIFASNMREGELTTETIFGPCLTVYSLANGIRDKNVLGFWPEAVKTYADNDIKEAVALSECHAKNAKDIVKGSDAWKLYKKLTQKTPMATVLDDNGNAVKDDEGKPVTGIEDYLPSLQYDNDEHRTRVVENIINNIKTIAYGEQGTLFHGILATNSIQEACKYWKLFKHLAPDLHVTSLFDPNTSENAFAVIEKEKALKEIVNDYNATYGTAFNRNTDPKLENFKKDLTSRLAHKGAYSHMGNNHNQMIDIVIVVDQLLTGFDSQWINIVYLDKVMETNNIIQAISRTNRVLNNEEKPWGMVKFYRKPYTMKRNLNEALKLYCQGDYSDVQIVELKDNIENINKSYDRICEIFAHDKIKNFECLPKTEEDRQMFKKEFHLLKTLVRAIILQGFKWSKKDETAIKFDEKIYSILTMRYRDLPSNKGGGYGFGKLGYLIKTDPSTMEMDKINAEYLEAQFKIVTIKDIIGDEAKAKKLAAIKEIENNLGTLSEMHQQYARQILEDIKQGKMAFVEGKTFRQYIQEAQDNAIRKAIQDYVIPFGLDEKQMYDLYTSTSDEIDILRLEALEETADPQKLKEHYNASVFKARMMFHEELKNYIEQHKAEVLNA